MKAAALLAVAMVPAAGAAFAHGGHLPAIEATGAGSFLALGFVVGLAHALDADHISAVATMVDRRLPRRVLAARGAIWGAGHTLSLMAICTLVVLLGLTISGRVEAALEFAVGVMIVLMGLRVLWRLHRDRIHLHVHQHGGERHIHLHSHAGDTADHARSRHDHSHRQGNLITLGIGLLHGAAGSAGLVVLSVAAAESTGQAIAYFALFGAGTMAGMTALTTLASWPLDRIQRGAEWMRTATSLAIAALALSVGTSVAVQSWPGLQAF